MALPLLLASGLGSSLKNAKIIKPIIYVIGGLIALFTLKGLFKTSPKTGLEKAKAELKEKSKQSGKDLTPLHAEMANDVAFALGIHKDISKWSIMGSTEDDEAANRVLQRMNSSDFEAVRVLYPDFTRGHSDLKNDLMAYLDKRYYERLPNYMKI